MATFVLKKYEPKKEDDTIEKTKETKEDNNALDKIKITVDTSISEIISELLYKKLSNVNIEVEEDKSESTIKAVSTENINSDPIKTFNSINNNDTIFIINKGFRTSKEEWFLTNLENKTSNIIYTEESFIRFIKSKLGI